MNIFLIRHGESIQNVGCNIQNLPDFKVTLTENGKNDAKLCGEFLKEYCTENNIDTTSATLFVSPFERTRQTAKIVNEYLNIPNIKEDALLIERQYGLFDNLTYEERAKYKDAYDFQNWMYQNGGNFYTKFPLGESNFDVFVRARFFLETLSHEIKTGNENFFIVSHGGFLKCLQMAYFNYSPEWFCEELYMNNCDVKLFQDIDGKRFDRDYIFRDHKKI